MGCGTRGAGPGPGVTVEPGPPQAARRIRLRPETTRRDSGTEAFTTSPLVQNRSVGSTHLVQRPPSPGEPAAAVAGGSASGRPVLPRSAREGAGLALHDAVPDHHEVGFPDSADPRGPRRRPR